MQRGEQVEQYVGPDRRQRKRSVEAPPLQRERVLNADSQRCDEILAIISHDLRAPLLTISTCAHALQRGSSDVHELADVIDGAASWSTRLISDMLMLMSFETGRFVLHCHATSLREILESLRTLFAPAAHAAGLHLQVDGPVAEHTVHVDADRVTQAVGNLITNALRASPPDGVVRVDASIHDGMLSIDVIDHGPGIPAERLEYLLGGHPLRRDPQRSGSGFGLAITKGIIAAHGGMIHATSAEGHGTAFSCRLPLVCHPTEE